MTEEREGRLARWSRLKRLHGGGERSGPSVAPEQPAGARGPAPAQENPPRATEEPAQPATPALELPPVAELNKDSDFTPFLRAGVPESAHREALRALWRSDPVFAFRDGLTDYDEDYTAIGMVDQVVRTAYQAGQGYLEVADATAPTDAPMDDTGETADALSPVSAASEAPSVEAVPTNAVAQSADEDAEVPTDGLEPVPPGEKVRSS